MIVPWLEFARASARWELGRLLRRSRMRPAGRALKPGLRHPGWPPLPGGETGPGQGFTIADRRRLSELAEWWASAGEGARLKGADLAERLRGELPDVPASVAARVLLWTGRHFADTADDEDDDHAALQAIADAMLAAPRVLADLAEIDEELTELAEGRPWR